MKNRNDKLLIEDIILSIDYIFDFMKDSDYDDFSKNDMMSSAVERKFEIIGEATAKISDELKDNFPEIPWQKMKAVRNIIIHGYFNVDLEILYNTSKKELSDLKKKLLFVIEKFE